VTRCVHAARLLLLATWCAACGGEPAPVKSSATVARPAVAKPAKARDPELDVGQVVLGLRGHEAELHECFRLGGGEGASFVELTWRVGPDGAVESTAVGRSTSTPPVAECLSERLSGARFGRPGQTRRASWTFVGGLVRFEDADTRKRNNKNAKKKNKSGNNEGESGIVIEPSSPGKLDYEAVEGVVQVGYRLFAHCYRDGLERDPTLGGAVRLRFVIGMDGQVARVIDGGSDLPDEAVVACVAEGFFAMRFPKPAGGNVHLRYRIHFDSG
jgi:hypothetical protein